MRSFREAFEALWILLGAGLWVAWEFADELGWEDTYVAEYLALTKLQADAFVTLDADLARRVEGVVPTATIDALTPSR